jgi:hypothetical protein
VTVPGTKACLKKNPINSLNPLLIYSISWLKKLKFIMWKLCNVFCRKCLGTTCGTQWHHLHGQITKDTTQQGKCNAPSWIAFIGHNTWLKAQMNQAHVSIVSQISPPCPAQSNYWRLSATKPPAVHFSACNIVPTSNQLQPRPHSHTGTVLQICKIKQA